METLLAKCLYQVLFACPVIRHTFGLRLLNDLSNQWSKVQRSYAVIRVLVEFLLKFSIVISESSKF